MIKVEPWTGGTSEEYETQLFGFGAQRLKIEIRQMVEQKIQSCFKEVESCYKESGKLSEEDKVALTEACEKLVRMYCERAGPWLDLLDEKIEQLMEVPHNVLLPEDEVQIEQTSDEEYEKLQQEVLNLRRNIERHSIMVALLKSEEEEMASVEGIVVVAKRDMEALDLLEKNLEGSLNAKSLWDEFQVLSSEASMLFKQQQE